MKFLSVILISFFALVTEAAPRVQKAFVYRFESQGSERGSCTATLFKVNQCYLVTNAHCIRSQHRLVPVDTSQVLLRNFGHLTRATSVRVTKVDHAADLAELSIPSALRSDCGRLENMPDYQRRMDYHTAFASIGFHRGQPQEMFTAGMSWNGFYQDVFARAVSTSLSNLDYVIEIPSLDMNYGMSGGATIDRFGHLFGINKSFVPFMGRTYVIPLPAVVSFVQGTQVGENSVDQTGRNSTRNAGENSGANGGENSGANGGENSGANGGENSGANGGDLLRPIDPDDAPAHDPLIFLREVDEGILINTSSGRRRLVAIGRNQIDGFDDYREHSPSNQIRIFAGDESFRANQSGVLSRFAGVYHNGGRTFEDRYSRRFQGSGAMEKLIVRRGILGYQLVHQYEANYQLRIGTPAGSNFRIVLRIPWYDVYGPVRNHNRSYYEEVVGNQATREEVFEGSISADGQLVTLQKGEKTFECPNKNFLKLICSYRGTEAEEFSLTRESLDQNEISFRHSKRKFINGVEHIILRYGTLQGQP